ncbi:MAG: thioesterase family protein [Halieaceae bacterium]|jgi:acyl-CoA thioester hydrolase
MSERAAPAPREGFAIFYSLNTRWADNDIYGHINNVAYYAFFDSVVNRFLIEEGGMRPGKDNVVGYVVNSSADYFSPLTYPQELDLGLRIARLGEKSVTWEIGVFGQGAELSSVTGRFTHAFVDREANKSAVIPSSIRRAIAALNLPSGS